MNNINYRKDSIAVVGMALACCLPRAGHFTEFWQNLKNGLNNAWVILLSRNIDKFDAALFSMSVREDKSMYSQQCLVQINLILAS